MWVICLLFNTQCYVCLTFTQTEGFTGRGRRRWKVLQFCSDENQQNIQNLSGAVEKPATNVMSLWSGMIVSCNALPEKWKWCRFDCSNQHGNMGDNLVNLPENEEYQSTQEVTKGKQRILKFWSWGGMGQQEIILTSNLQLDPIFLPNFLSCGNNNMSGASALCVLTPYLVACAVWQPCLFYLSNKQDFCCFPYIFPKKIHQI